MLEAIHAAAQLGVHEQDVVVASVYTTQSITSVMERIRDQIKAGTPTAANFALGPTGQRAVFNLPDLASISWRQHIRVNPDDFRNMSIDLAVLQVVPGAVGTIAYGLTFHPTTTFTLANTSLRWERGPGLRSCKATTISTSRCICLLALGP